MNPVYRGTRRPFMGLFSIFIIFSFLSVVFPGVLFASGDVELKAVRHFSSAGYTRVVLDLSGQTEFKEGRLSNPDRICIDISGGKLGGKINKSLKIGNGVLKSVRTGQFEKDTVRIVLDIEGMKNYEIFTLNNPERLVVDIYGSYSAPRAKEAEFEAKKTPSEAKKTVQEARRIVIDAGHGGHDPGAVGKGGLREKDVALAISYKLKEILEKDPSNRIFLTRDKDIYLRLDERNSIAARHKADLFISVHVNASPNRKARGIETYFLNWTDDEEELKVAARENLITVRKLKEARSELDVILASLELDIKRNESLKLANYIQGSMVSSLSNDYQDIYDLGVKKGPFYVLYTKGAPSVLVEVSFISNTIDEKRLKSRSYIAQLAEGIAGGIKTYIAAMPPELKFAQR
jgi:N-acetylmuramoyl-L-alanine amidase